MNDEALKKLWREQPLALPAPLTGREASDAMNGKMRRFDRCIWRRDFGEVAACLVVAVVFGGYFFWFPSALARLGCVITILSAVFIGWRLLSSKRRAGKSRPGASVMEALQVELRKVENQIGLLRSVWWWYILPVTVGYEVFFFGVNREATDRMAFVAVGLAMGLGLDWLNQRAVRKQLMPLKEELESLLGIPPEIRKVMKSDPIKTIMQILLVITVGAVLLGGLASRLRAQGKPRSDAEIQAMLERCVAGQGRAPGLAVGIIDDSGARLFCKGTLEKGAGGEVNGETVFEIGSITKVFTALLLEEMAESGEVKLDDPIGKYLPASVKTPARQGRQITLVDLATQTSGLPRLPDNLAPKDSDNPYADYTVEQLYEFLARYELKRDIGEKYRSSNLGGGLLGHVLALRAGTNYEALALERICQPLGMSSTRITLSPELKARLATGHNAFGAPVKNWDLPTLAGAGALRSTANDLLKFVAANIGLTHCSLSHAMMETHQPRHRAGAFRKIGLMWQIDTAHDTVWHNGGTGGYRSYIGFKAEKRRGVVVLANSANDVDDIGQYLLGDRAEVKDYKAPKARKIAAINPRVFDGFVGQYQFPMSKVRMTITREGDRLFGQMTGQQKIEFFPETETDVFCTVVDAQMTFVKDASGQVTHLILHQNGIDQKVRKEK